MRIAILGNQARGMINFWLVLINTMRRYGHEVACFVPDADSEWATQLRQQGIVVRGYPLDRKGINPLNDLETLYELYRDFDELKPDALFAFTIKPIIYGCLAARFAGIPHIFATITGLGYTFETETFLKRCLNKLAIFLYRAALSRAERIFFQNQDDKKMFVDAGIVKDSDKIVMCKGTGVDTEHFAPAPVVTDPPTFLLVGRLLEAKGITEFAAAAHKLKIRYPNARFQVLGPQETGLGSISPKLIEAWVNAGDIEYLGETTDVRPYITKASVMVLPSWREGTPCAIMEGMSMGRPAVVTDAPGCREVVQDGVNGILVPVKNEAHLADAMESFILDPQKITQMGAASRRMAEDVFDARTVAAQILTAMRVENRHDQ